jgi:hypothetical protein
VIAVLIIVFQVGRIVHHAWQAARRESRAKQGQHRR